MSKYWKKQGRQINRENDISTQDQTEKERTWLQKENGNHQRQENISAEKKKRKKDTFCIGRLQSGLLFSLQAVLGKGLPDSIKMLLSGTVKKREKSAADDFCCQVAAQAVP